MTSTNVNLSALDINECNNVPSPCEDICTNTPGAYECSCSMLGDIITEGGQCIGT